MPQGRFYGTGVVNNMHPTDSGRAVRIGPHIIMLFLCLEEEAMTLRTYNLYATVLVAATT
jgi:hypothetical protein